MSDQEYESLKAIKYQENILKIQQLAVENKTLNEGAQQTKD